MTKMRNGWEDDVRINSLQHEASISRPQLTNIPAAEKSESLYDFGISTNRPISAPLPSGIGLDLLKGLDDWRSGYTESIESNSASVYKDAVGMKSVNDVLNMPSFSKRLSAPLAAKFTPHYPHGNSIPRPKSAAPQLNGTFFSNQKMKENKVSVDVADSLFRDFEIMNVGSKRAASTGVIEDGELSSSSYSAVSRDVPLGLSSLDKSTGNEKLASYMDVIEENSPVKPLSRGFQSDESDTSRVAAEFNFNQVSYQKVTPHDNTVHKPQEMQYSHRGGDGSSRHLPGHPQNQMKYESPSHMMAGTTHNALNHMSHVSQSPNASHPMYVQQSAAHNPFVQNQGMQYYDLHQMDSIAAAQQGISYMQPQRVRNDARSLSDAYGNPTFGGGGVAGGGYPSVQYHHPLSPQYNHAPSILPHDPNMMNSNPATISHAQPFFTAIPVQGAIPASSTGAFIYFHPTDMSSVQSQTYSIINASGLNSNSVPVSPPRLQNTAGRTSQKNPTLRHVIVEQNGRKSSRNNSRKSGNTTFFDSSKHASLSSGALSLLEEYRSSKDRFWTAKDVKGHIVEFCQDQNGSRFIQQRLEIANADEKYVIASEVLPSVEGLRNDVFGNYVVQKLFENCNADVKLKLKNSMVGHMVNLSSQVYGCRVVQKALEKLGDDDLVDLLSEFHSHALSCIHDQNGNHVIQKIIEVVSTRCKIYQAEDNSKAIMFSAELDFILDCVTKNVVSLSCHPFGCRVMQRILEHCIESQRAATLDCIQKHLRTLMDDQYGNYVIQHVLQFGRKSDRDVVIEIIVENGILELSRQKFASNVIEKLLKYGNSNHRNTIIREMLKLVEDKSLEEGQSSIVLLMVRDAYANYVVQTTLDVAPEGTEKKLLLEELKSNASKLRNYTFAKHIITKLEEAENKGMRHKFG